VIAALVLIAVGLLLLGIGRAWESDHAGTCHSCGGDCRRIGRGTMLCEVCGLGQGIRGRR
jgi:predicted amidophosphoribosyltransferase